MCLCVSLLALLAMFFWVRGIPYYDVIAQMTSAVAVVALTLVLEDFYKKVLQEETRKKLLRPVYFAGSVTVILAILAFWWASDAVILKDMIMRLGLMLFLSLLGCFWLLLRYPKSATSFEEYERARWDKIKPSLHKKRNAEEVYETLRKTLLFRLSGDSPDGDLDFGIPLAIHDDKVLTLAQLEKLEQTEDVAEKTDATRRYLLHLATALFPQEKE